MRLLLDECVDRRLARDLSDHDVATVVDLPLAVAVLRAKSNRLVDLGLRVPALLQALMSIKQGEVKWVEG